MTEPIYFLISSGYLRIASEIGQKITPDLASSSRKVVATDTEFKNPQEIINQIEDATIKTGLQMMPKALPSFALDPKMQPAVQDDLGEIIGPPPE